MNEKYPLALPEGTILAGQYTIEKVLGQGGFGITYRATDYKTNQKVAVKEFFPDTLAHREETTVISYPGERSENYEYGKESFLQEAKTLAEFIGNENIVRIHSYFEENGTAYFVMDYIEGISFDEYIKGKGGKISVEEAKQILIPVMDALNVVHSKGIVHRDVTPDNIYITNDGTVKLLDFGAARYSLGDKSRSLDVILKHGFAPKEQYTRRGKQGPYTDIYSLAATFYFAITGKRPPDSVDRLDEDDLILPSNLGVDITNYQETAILQAMSVQPDDRFVSMAVFKKVLLNENTTTNRGLFAAPEAAPSPTAYQTSPVIQQSAQVYQQNSTAAQSIPQLSQKEAPLVQSVKQKLKERKYKALIAGIACAVVVVFFVGIAVSKSVGAGLGSPEEAFEAWLNGYNRHDFDLMLKAYPDFRLEYEGGKAKLTETLQKNYNMQLKKYEDQGILLIYRATDHSMLDKDEAEKVEQEINDAYDANVHFSAVATVDYQLIVVNGDTKNTSSLKTGGYAVKYKGRWYYFNHF